MRRLKQWLLALGITVVTCGLFMLPVAAAPQVTAVTISGAPNTHARGAAVFDPVQVRVTADRFSEDNLLTPAGLGWHRDSRVVPLSGAAVGRINSESFWTRNNPQRPVTAYALAAGTAGRITHVGDTRAGTRLDLLYTVTDTDATWWQAHSDYAGPFRVHGIAFTGEQYLKNTTNNAIVVLYNGANRVKIHYQIVRHGTNEEVPVLVSFIATDIDVSQGVMTNLHNLARLIPQGTNLREAGRVIYDQSNDVQNPYGKDLNGAADLPAGGYLGVCFNSHFDYTFYAPAPANAGVYQTASGVRYDLFGSALQAKMAVDRQTHLTVRYQDDTGRALKPAQEIKSLNTFAASPAAPKIRRYRLTATQTQTPAPDEKRLTYTYTPETTLTIRAVDQASGRPLAKARTLTLLKGQRYQIAPPAIRGYRPPKGQTVIAAADQTVTLGYRKIAAPSRGSQPKTRRAAPRPKRRSARRAASPKRTAPKRPTAAVHPPKKPAGPAAPKPKKGKAKQKIDWFEKNTGIEKTKRKYILDTLNLIAKHNRKVNKYTNEEQIRRDQWYFIAGTAYSKNPPQVLTSYVWQYSKSSLVAKVGKKRAEKFTDILKKNHTAANSSRSKNYVDLAHLAVTVASSKDHRLIPTFLHARTTYPKWTTSRKEKRSFKQRLENTWALDNGYFGDYMTEWNKIPNSDLYPDLDTFAMLRSQKPVEKTLKQYYSKKTSTLNKKRKTIEKNLNKQSRKRLHVATISLGLLGAWGVFRNRKKYKKTLTTKRKPKRSKRPIFNHIILTKGHKVRRWAKTIRRKGVSKIKHLFKRIRNFKKKKTKHKKKGRHK